jgi:DNA-binding NtrC family response regulator
VGVCVRQRIAEVEPPFRTNAILFRRHRRNIKTPVPGTYSIEKEYIIAVLELNGGNQTRTAEQLRIGLATIYRKL